VTIATTYVNAEAFQPYATLQQGIPTLLGPDVSSGRVPLDRAAAVYTPEIDNIDRGYVHTWNIAYQRLLAASITVDVAYVGAKGVGGYAGLDINAPQTLGGGDGSRPYASLGRLIAINSWGERLKTDYKSLQVAFNKPFSHGFLFKGAYTLAKAMNESNDDGRATLLFNTPSELGRNWAPGGIRPATQPATRIRVRAAVAEQGRRLRQHRERRSRATGRSTACSPHSAATRSP
jgi:hypothetical protein